MTWLFIIVAMLLVLAPAIALLPSPRQKEQMAKRRLAMDHGISVELTGIGDPDPDPEKYRSVTGKPLERIRHVAAYRVQRKRPSDDWRRTPRLNWRLVRRSGDGSRLPAPWEWEDTDLSQFSTEFLDFLEASLDGFSVDVIMVEETSWVISLYWNEEGDDTQLDHILRFLKTCIEITPHPPLGACRT